MMMIASLTLCAWCWFGCGPHSLRWPSICLIILISSRHPLALYAEQLGTEALTLMIPLLLIYVGLKVLLRPLFGSSRPPNPHSRNYYSWQQYDANRSRRSMHDYK